MAPASPWRYYFPRAMELEHIRVFLVDDHSILRMGLPDMLRRDPDIEVVGSTSCAANALDALAGQEIDVLLTDLRMPEVSGEALIAEVRNRSPKVAVGVLTTYHSDEDIFNSVKAGAMAYILKSASMDQIVEAIRCLKAGSTWFPRHISKQLTQRLSRTQLSMREVEVLRIAAKGLRNRGDRGGAMHQREHCPQSYGQPDRKARHYLPCRGDRDWHTPRTRSAGRRNGIS